MEHSKMVRHCRPSTALTNVFVYFCEQVMRQKEAATRERHLLPSLSHDWGEESTVSLGKKPRPKILAAGPGVPLGIHGTGVSENLQRLLVRLEAEKRTQTVPTAASRDPRDIMITFWV